VWSENGIGRAVSWVAACQGGRAFGLPRVCYVGDGCDGGVECIGEGCCRRHQLGEAGTEDGGLRGLRWAMGRV